MQFNSNENLKPKSASYADLVPRMLSDFSQIARDTDKIARTRQIEDGC
jgi:hypothetical protein